MEKSPFAERLVRRGYEVLYLTEAVDEYCLSSLPEYDGKKFQNIAKEIFDLDESQYLYVWLFFIQLIIKLKYLLQ